MLPTVSPPSHIALVWHIYMISACMVSLHSQGVTILFAGTLVCGAFGLSFENVPLKLHVATFLFDAVLIKSHGCY